MSDQPRSVRRVSVRTLNRMVYGNPGGSFRQRVMRRMKHPVSYARYLYYYRVLRVFLDRNRDEQRR